MSAVTVARMPEVSRGIIRLYAQLSHEAIVQRVKMWKMSPKHHIFTHLCEWQIPDLKLNPRSYWTYADEDLVGRTVEVAESCHVTTLAVVAMTKWLLMEHGSF